MSYEARVKLLVDILAISRPRPYTLAGYWQVLQDDGAHHELIELVEPDIKKLEGDQYSAVLDVTQGDIEAEIEKRKELTT